MHCHFSSAKKSLSKSFLDCLSCLVTCLCLFGYFLHCFFFFLFRLLSVSELTVKILFYLPTCMPVYYLPTFMLSQEVWHSMACLAEATSLVTVLSLIWEINTSFKTSHCSYSWKGGWVVPFTTPLGKLFLFLTPPMGNFFLPVELMTAVSYPEFQDRAWLYFLSSLVSTEGFYQFTQKLSLLQPEQAHLPQLLLAG